MSSAPPSGPPIQRDAKSRRAEAKATDLMTQAEKRLKDWSFFSNKKYEDAQELYENAGGLFKVAEMWAQSMEAYEKAAALASKLGHQHEHNRDILEAAKVAKNFNPTRGIELYTQCAYAAMDTNRLATAAKYYKEIANLHTDLAQYQEAISAWSEAASCYETEDSKSTANACTLKIAELAIEIEDYKRAYETLEKIASVASSSKLGRWGVKDRVYHATLCHMVLGAKENNLEPAREAFNNYQELYPQFEGTREAKFLDAVIEKFITSDEVGFQQECAKFDHIYKIDPLALGMLTKIKTVLSEGHQAIAASPGEGPGSSGPPEITDPDDEFR